jgi:anaerobic sulfite reductase subunit B
VLFAHELKRWQKTFRVTTTVDNDEEYAWMGSIGFVVDFIKDVPTVGDETRVVLIGPPLMMTNSIRELARHGVREEHVWVSLERHMKCGVGKCGHCRIREKCVCLDGPVFNYIEAKQLID